MTSDNAYTSLLKVKSDIEAQIEELKADVEAVERLLKRHIPESTNGQSNGHKVESAKNLQHSFANLPAGILVDKPENATTWKQKVIYIVRELNGAYADDVAQKLYDYSWVDSVEDGKRKATLYLSSFYGDGLLKADKSGRKYKYFL